MPIKVYSNYKENIPRKRKRDPFVREWISIKVKMPHEFDLVEVLCNSGWQQSAWWTGIIWDSARPLKKDSVVISWRRIPIDH